MAADFVIRLAKTDVSLINRPLIGLGRQQDDQKYSQSLYFFFFLILTILLFDCLGVADAARDRQKWLSSLCVFFCLLHLTYLHRPWMRRPEQGA